MMVLNAAFVVGVGSTFASVASAESLNDLKNQQNQLEKKSSELDSDINSTDTKIKDLQSKQAKLEAEIERVDKAVEETNGKIRTKNKEIKDTKAEIEQLEKDIEVLKERIEKRTEILNERALSFQENEGQVDYLEVVFGASSFADFIDRVGAVTTIVEADNDLVKQHEDDKAELESSQKAVETKLADLEDMRADLQAMKEKLARQKAQKDKVMAQLEQEEHEAHDHKLSLAEEQEILASQKDAIAKAIANEKQRIADEAAAKKAAEEQARAQAAKSKSSSSVSSSSSKSGGSSPSVSVSPGSWTQPASGRFSSGYGARWGKTHAGVDIANGADVPIVAAANGVVIRSYYSSSYGNAVLISHYINGQTYTTLYAHMETRMVSSGQTVGKGQQIGIMGNTGRSTGQHLHFELHRGEWNVGKTNAINPVGIVPMP